VADVVTASQVVPTDVERIPLYHWRPGTRCLVVGARDGADFAGGPEDLRTYQRRIDPDLLREAAARTGCTEVAAAWRNSLRADAGLELLRGTGIGELVIACSGHADPRRLGELCGEVAAWSLLVSARPGPACATIMERGRHVEVVVGVGDEPLPRSLPWSRVAACHLQPLAPSRGAGRAFERALDDAAATVAGTVRIYRPGERDTTCRGCGAILLWRSPGRVRVDRWDPVDGRCRDCGEPADLVPAPS